MIECSVHGKCFNIGRRRAINLTQASNLEYKSHQHQCSVASVKLEGGVFENGLNIDEFIRAVRLTGLSVSAEKMKAVIHACTQATHEEYKEQQKLIGNEYKLEQNLKVGMDTSFSQGRSATHSQTACLKHKSGDIVRVEKHMDICIESKVPLSVINTDECGQLANLFKRKSEKQSLKI